MNKTGDFFRAWGWLIVIALNGAIALAMGYSVLWVQKQIRDEGDNIQKNISGQVEAIRIEFRNYVTRKEMDDLKNEVARKMTYQEHQSYVASHDKWGQEAIALLKVEIREVGGKVELQSVNADRRLQRIEALVDRLVTK